MSKGLSDALQKTQNRAARVITQSDYSVRFKDLLDDLGWNNLATRRMINKLCWIYKSINKMTPTYLSDIFSKRGCSQPYDLRNEYNISLPKPRTEYLKRSFQYKAAKLWNQVPCDIRNSTNIKHFKKGLVKLCNDSPSVLLD